VARTSSAPGRPLRLLEVAVRWPPETFLVTKFRGLAERGFDVTVLTIGGGRITDPIPGVTALRGFGHRRSRVVSAVVAASQAFLLLVRHPRRLRTLVAELRRLEADNPGRSGRRTLGLLVSFMSAARLRADVVQFEWESAAAHYLPLYDVWGVPVVLACRGSGIDTHPYDPAYAHTLVRLPEAFGRAAAVHCVSTAIRDRAARFGLDPVKAHVINPGVDLAFFCPAEASDEHPELRVLSLGHLLWVKGYDDALRAIHALVERGVDVRYDIVGADPAVDRGPGWSEQILFTIADLGLADRVSLLGGLDPADVRDRLRRTDVLLHASLSEGLPTAVVEAMACGVPVVTTSWPGVEEAVGDGVEGLVRPRRDPAALAEALAQLAADPERRRHMGLAARARAERQFDERMEIAAFERLYADVVQRRPRPSTER
jgi:glycosyltransferase involved in cell wall biosynthesis